MLFTGEFEHTIDAKQRLAIPSEIRTRLDPEQHGTRFYLAPGSNGSLWLWPERTFEQLAAALERSLVPADDMMQFEELLFSQSVLLDMDKTGRIRLPERVLSEYGLGPRVIIVGIKDHLELRMPEQWTVTRQQGLAKQRQIMQQARLAMQEALRGGKQDGP